MESAGRMCLNSLKQKNWNTLATRRALKIQNNIASSPSKSDIQNVMFQSLWKRSWPLYAGALTMCNHENKLCVTRKNRLQHQNGQ